MGRNERLKLMLNQQNPSLSGRMMVYYDYLNKTRLKKIARIDEDMQALHDLELEHLKETTVLEDKLEKRKREQDPDGESTGSVPGGFAIEAGAVENRVSSFGKEQGIPYG